MNGEKNCQMHGQASQEPFHKTKGHLTDIHGPEGDLRGNKQPQDPTVFGQMCGNLRPMQRKRKQSKDGYRETKARQRQTIERNILY